MKTLHGTTIPQIQVLKKIVEMEEVLAKRAADKADSELSKAYYNGQEAAFKRMLWMIENPQTADEHCQHAFNRLGL